MEALILKTATGSLGTDTLATTYSLHNLIFGNINTINTVLSSGFSYLTIPSSITSIISTAFSGMNTLNYINLYSSFDISLNLSLNPLSEDCLIDIANKLKDNTGLTSKTLTLQEQFCKSKMILIYVDTNGNKVNPGTTGAVTLLEFITNKNWTVTFSTSGMVNW